MLIKITLTKKTKKNIIICKVSYVFENTVEGCFLFSRVI